MHFSFHRIGLAGVSSPSIFAPGLLEDFVLSMIFRSIDGQLFDPPGQFAGGSLQQMLQGAEQVRRDLITAGFAVGNSEAGWMQGAHFLIGSLQPLGKHDRQRVSDSGL